MTDPAEKPFDAFAEANRPALEAELRRCLPEISPDSLARAVSEAVLSPGKRLRALAALAAGQFAGSPEAASMAVAVAVEYVHAASLVLDDLPSMDNARRRRGRPALHVSHGTATAELVSVCLVARAFELVAGAPSTSAATRARLTRELAQAVEACCAGQAADLEAQADRLRLEDLEAIHARKTGALFIAAVRGGAHAGGAREPQLESLTRFARNLGLAFQITDDLLDREGDQALMGKDRGQDAHRANFARLLGSSSSRRLVDELLAAAVDALRPLGRRARLLSDLARVVAERRA
ncbi:MAG TPA: polyprenyl synthetase family protein [Thermoanaerobaculia bacterium]|nr:polyprenyl synthetase family protein [Thermoanaerobaculia bacterium]